MKVLNTETGEFECQDIDECGDEIDDCSFLNVCVNTYGGYECQLECGFNEVYTDCIDESKYDCKNLVWDFFTGWIVNVTSVQDNYIEKCESGCKCEEGFY